MKADISSSHKIEWRTDREYPLKIENIGSAGLPSCGLMSKDEALALRDALIEVMPLETNFKHWTEE